MNTPKILLAYYSRTGYTSSIARQLAENENWDIEEIIDHHSRTGPLGFLRCMFDVMTGRYPAIRLTVKDPSQYDLVVLGASVWMRQLSSPIRTYIAQHRDKFSNVAFICTYGGYGAENAAAQCSALSGKPLVATCAITDNEIERSDYWPKLDAFIKQIHQFTPAR